MIIDIALEASFLQVGTGIFLIDLTLEGKIQFLNCQIGKGVYCRNFFIRHADAPPKQSSFDLSRSTINGEFQWHQKKARDTFDLRLKNVSVSHLSVSHWNVASKNLHLTGFKYQNLDSQSNAAGNIKWLLERDDLFSLQPFLQLASVLNNNGEEEKAKDVKIEGKKEPEHGEVFSPRSGTMYFG